MKLGIISKNNKNHQKSYDTSSVSITNYQNHDESSSLIAANGEDNVVLEYFNENNSSLYKNYAIYAAAAIGIACFVVAAAATVSFPIGSRFKDVILPDQLGIPYYRDYEEYAFQEGMFKDLTLADRYGRTASGTITNTDYCRYLQAQLKDDNGNWKLSTFDLNKYIYADKEGELQYADIDKQPGYFANSAISCSLDVRKGKDCRTYDRDFFYGYNVKLLVKTKYSGGVFGGKDKEKDTYMYIKLSNIDGSFVDHLYTDPQEKVCWD